jgi:hypothetical protein
VASTSEGGNGRPNIGLLVSDIDGTLVRPDKTIAPATIEAVTRLRDAGIHFSIISARPARGMRYPIETLRIDQPTAAFNGGTITRADGTIAMAKHLSDEAAGLALEFLDRAQVEIWVFADGKWITRDPDGEFVPRERRAVGFEPTIVPDFAGITRIDKIVGASSDHPRLAGLEGELAGLLGERAHAVRSQAYYLDVTHPEADKGHGVAALAEVMGLPVDRVAVIGDAPNDVPMFRRAALSIAMGQAFDEVKAEATYVTTTNEEDGIARAIERFILPAG